jgi:UPF0042 nucleotide-binding protein
LSKLADVAEVLVVTGLSGAGRSQAANVLEDLGWYVVDNLPTSLVSTIVDLASKQGSAIERLCLVVGRPHQRDIVPVVDDLRDSEHHVRMLFLDCSDEALVRRYESTRRRHPFADEADTVHEAIKQERHMLEPLRAASDVIVDTSDLNVHQLRARMVALFEPRGVGQALQVNLMSFGFKHGLPLDADMVFDVRFLPNPHWDEALRSLTGLTDRVRSYVFSDGQAQGFLAKVLELLSFMLDAHAADGRSYLTIAVGCTGGHHRSVALVESLAEALRSRSYAVRVSHRDIDR